MKTFLRQHRQALGAALRKLRRAAGLLGALVIGVALALPAGGYAVLEGVRGVASRLTLDPQVSVFLRPGAQAGAAEEVGAALRADKRARNVRFVSREEAVKELGAVQGMAEVINALGHNPLPDAFVVKVPGESLDAFAADVRKLEPVEHVQADSEWAHRLAALAAVGRLALWFLAALLGVGLIAITFNTIGMQILTQRPEIEVLKLIGATDAFIQRPFYYLGLLQGLAGGAVALLIVAGGLALLNGEVRAVAASYGSGFQFPYPGLGDAAAITGFAGLVGWLGAFLSVRRRLREMEPTL